jgi:hypothetical protein
MRQNYNDMAEEYDREFLLKWREQINSHLVYKNPELVNYEFYREEDHITSRTNIELTTMQER